MRKTSVYLTDEQVDALRRISEDTGTSQADLIRDAVQQRIEQAPPPERVFHSMGVGAGDGRPATEPIDPDEFYEWIMGRRR